MSELIGSTLHAVFWDLVGLVALYYAGGTALAWALHERSLHWSWVWLVALLGLIAWFITPVLAVALLLVSLRAGRTGARWQREEEARGADVAHAALARRRPQALLRDQLERRRQSARAERGDWIRAGWLEVGRDGLSRAVSIPAGGRSGSHALILGATGSGKTVSEAWIAGRLIEAGHGAIVIDPKGDQLLEQELALSAALAGKRFLRWTPAGPVLYNPYGSGSDSEIADKALVSERFTEPHYQRQAQRYLGHAVRAMRMAGIAVTPAALAGHLDPLELEVTARTLPEACAQQIHDYLDSLSERQRGDLAGMRDRLSILAESDIGPWLDPEPRRDGPAAECLTLQAAVEERAVVYFGLEADRRPLLIGMLAGAILTDLIGVAAALQGQPIPTAVVIDEFAAIASDHIARLFARARSAGLSLVLCTQELADLTRAGRGLREQVLANIEGLLSHRQNVPESAELIAAIAGTRPTWITSEQTDARASETQRGSRHRGHEYEIHPSLIKDLPNGVAAVITPGSGQSPTIAKIHHPQLRRNRQLAGAPTEISERRTSTAERRAAES